MTNAPNVDGDRATSSTFRRSMHAACRRMCCAALLNTTNSLHAMRWPLAKILLSI